MLTEFNKHLKTMCECHKTSLVITKGLYLLQWENKNCWKPYSVLSLSHWSSKTTDFLAKAGLLCQGEGFGWKTWVPDVWDEDICVDNLKDFESPDSSEPSEPAEISRPSVLRASTPIFCGKTLQRTLFCKAVEAPSRSIILYIRSCSLWPLVQIWPAGKFCLVCNLKKISSESMLSN